MAVVVLPHESRALAGNPLGDPHIRDLHVVTVGDIEHAGAVPCLWYLSGYAGAGRAALSYDLWQEGLEQRLERLFAEGVIGPMIVALPDTFTKLGGAQHLGSLAVGDYETYLLSELRRLVEGRFHVSAHAIAGKSSGGFGAIVHAMRRPGLFRAVACHSGDMGFRLSVWPDIPALMNALHEHGGVREFVRAFERTPKKRDRRWFEPMSVLAMSAVYSPDPAGTLGIQLPFDLERGELDLGVLARWQAFDPVEMIEQPAHRSALSEMALVYFDCGRRDEHQLHWGARALHAKLVAFGVPHEHEEFDDGHRDTAYRLDTSLPKIYRALR